MRSTRGSMEGLARGAMEGLARGSMEGLALGAMEGLERGLTRGTGEHGSNVEKKRLRWMGHMSGIDTHL